jgi:trk system potassium uptake protein
MKIVIADGGKTASFIIDMFKTRENELVVINSSHTQAASLMKNEHISVYVGNPWRHYVLEEAGVYGADVFIALCEQDTDNFASCTMAKKLFGVKKCICVVNNPENVDLYKKLGVDSVISSTYLLAQSIKSESSVESLIKTLSIENDKIQVIEAVVLAKYKIANCRIMDIDFPKTASIAAIYRKYQIFIPNGQVTLLPRDTLVIVTTPEHRQDVLDFVQKEK